MTSPPEKKSISCCSVGLKPLTGHNVMFYYAPMQGAISYTALSVNVMNPSLMLRVFPRRDMTNILLINTLLGSGLYLYSRHHLKKASTEKRIMLSAFGAVSFSLGSVLVWAILRSIIPQNVALCTAAGVGSGLALMKLGWTYTDHVDALCSLYS